MMTGTASTTTSTDTRTIFELTFEVKLAARNNKRAKTVSDWRQVGLHRPASARMVAVGAIKIKIKSKRCLQRLNDATNVLSSSPNASPWCAYKNSNTVVAVMANVTKKHLTATAKKMPDISAGLSRA